VSRDYRYKEIQLVQLRSFCEAAARGNFTSAAKNLNLSVSTVWEQVRALEQKLGTSLLRQQGRSVELTPKGRLFMELVQPHVHGLDSLERLFEAGRAGLPRRLTVASSQYLLHGHLAGPMQAFTAAHPDVHVSIVLPDAQQVAPLVERGEVDLAVFPYDRQERRSPVLNYEALFELPLAVVLSRQHPLAQQSQLSLTDLCDLPVILPGRESFSRRVIDRVLLEIAWTPLSAEGHYALPKPVREGLHRVWVAPRLSCRRRGPLRPRLYGASRNCRLATPKKADPI
jgi:DNA-binding transcriptional LysR family regulator